MSEYFMEMVRKAQEKNGQGKNDDLNRLADTLEQPVQSCERIGEGGFANVFKIEIQDKGEFAAKEFTLQGLIEMLKYIPEDSENVIEGLQKTIPLEVQQGMPNMMGYHFGLSKGNVLVCQYVKGITLGLVSDFVAARSEDIDGFNLYKIIQAGEVFADALAHVHASGVIHRDIKLDNVMVNATLKQVAGLSGLPEYFKATLIDGEFATYPNNPHLIEGSVLGTPGCISPESAAGSPSNESDVYALGAEVYRLLTGERLRLRGVANLTEQEFWSSLTTHVTVDLVDWYNAQDILVTSEFRNLERALQASQEIQPENRPSARELSDELMYTRFSYM